MRKRSALWEHIDELGPYEGIGTLDVYAGRGYLGRRQNFVQVLTWAIPTPGAVEEIARFIGNRRTLEVCAGTGVWAALLRQHGVQITATDLNPPASTFFPVEALDAVEAVKKHQPDVLFLCWPPYAKLTAYNALRAFRGDLVVYIGEDSGGCTGCDKFHALLEAEWTKRHYPILRWEGIYDGVYLLERIKAGGPPVSPRTALDTACGGGRSREGSPASAGLPASHPGGQAASAPTPPGTGDPPVSSPGETAGCHLTPPLGEECLSGPGFIPSQVPDTVGSG